MSTTGTILGGVTVSACPTRVERQRAYAKVLRLSSVYTPQSSHRRARQFVGSDVKSIGRALTGTRDGRCSCLAVRDGEVSSIWMRSKKPRRAMCAGGLSADGSIAHRPRGECRAYAERIQYRTRLSQPGPMDRQSSKQQYHARVDSLPRDSHRRGTCSCSPGTGTHHRGGDHRAPLRSFSGPRWMIERGPVP